MRADAAAEAIQELEAAAEALAYVLLLIRHGSTRAQAIEAYRRLAGVQGICARVGLALQRSLNL